MTSCSPVHPSQVTALTRDELIQWGPHLEAMLDLRQGAELARASDSKSELAKMQAEVEASAVRLRSAQEAAEAAQFARSPAGVEAEDEMKALIRERRLAPPPHLRAPCACHGVQRAGGGGPSKGVPLPMPSQRGSKRVAS
jgi:hypothetical protein